MLCNMYGATQDLGSIFASLILEASSEIHPCPVLLRSESVAGWLHGKSWG